MRTPSATVRASLDLFSRSLTRLRSTEPRSPVHHDGNGRFGIIEGAKNEPLAVARDPY